MPKKPAEKSQSESIPEEEALKSTMQSVQESILESVTETVTNSIKRIINDSVSEMSRQLHEQLQQQLQLILEAQEQSRKVQERPRNDHGQSRSVQEHMGEVFRRSDTRDASEEKSPGASRIFNSGRNPITVDAPMERNYYNPHHRNDQRLRKLKMPTFEGENPDGWIMQAERFFACCHYSEEEKVEAAFISFSGDALLWYQFENKKRAILSWEEMKRLVLRHFRDTRAGSLYDQFVAVRQEGTVIEFNRQFIRLLAPLENVSPEIQLSTFINGLRPTIRGKLRVQRPRNIDEAMEIAQDIEEELNATTHYRPKGI
ncbi:hypothetical protein F8388_022340 [Cannabis sativa]|uniref:Retrotransposon gag domain-containing protein n=1 Tax=Cannabis sativa TaxID=3483 RepID=A0A7J6G8U4_CANSA|nr:hypothetical protein F8388_022340 [Cannabis sativa]